MNNKALALRMRDIYMTEFNRLFAQQKNETLVVAQMQEASWEKVADYIMNTLGA